MNVCYIFFCFVLFFDLIFYLTDFSYVDILSCF